MLTQDPVLHGDVGFPLLGVCLAPPDRRVSGGGSAIVPVTVSLCSCTVGTTGPQSVKPLPRSPPSYFESFQTTFLGNAADL